ncbi:MAG TPA: hypothetical protein VJ044_14690 [Candidatus Hodarchaeales archaeon]|nr:hypothetical protein [Candidatus Hodarchaeales archaeon]
MIKLFQIIGQWLLIIGVLFGVWSALDRRVTKIEAAGEQEMKGYNVIIEELNKRLDRSDAALSERLNYIVLRIDVLVSKAHTHGGS